MSNVELAVISASGIAPDSIPSGAMHWAETNENMQSSLKIRLATKNLHTSLKEEGREEKDWLGIDARPVFTSGS